ncbi:MAG: DUF6502 family protein [Thiohalomonadales bacterium]
MDSKKNSVLAATAKLMEPLIRILMSCGVSHVEFNELAKKLFVKVGYDHFGIQGRKTSISRVSVLSGLSRKEVVKITNLLENNLTSSNVSRPLNRASRVLGGWLQDKNYQGKKNKPRTLIIRGDKFDFKQLVKQYSGDVTHGAILDELLRIEAVKLVGENKVTLISQGYVPVSDELDKLTIMGTSASDLLTTIDHNLHNSKEPRFQREVVYGQLSKAGINEFRIVSRDKCNALILDLNQWLANKKRIEKELGLTQPGTRTGIGIYYIEDIKKDDVDEGELEE